MKWPGLDCAQITKAFLNYKGLRKEKKVSNTE